MVSANSAESHAGIFHEIEILAIIGLTIVVTYTMFTQEMKKDLYEFFCYSRFNLYTVLEQTHEG